MPCDTITTVTLELKNANLDILSEALLRLKFQVNSIDKEKGILQFSQQNGLGYGYYLRDSGNITIRQNQEMAKIIKQTYSAVLVERQFKKFGWQKQTTKTEAKREW